MNFNDKNPGDENLVVLRKAEPTQRFKTDFSQLEATLTKEEIAIRNAKPDRDFVNFDDLLENTK